MSDVIVLTTTLYPSASMLRFDLACRMTGSAIGHGHQTLILDDSPDSHVAEGLKRIGAVVVGCSVVEGMAAGRRKLFACASKIAGWQFGLWNEPEKDDLIRFIPEITAPLREGSADIVVVGRTEASWQTCPKLQRESETRANEIYREVTGLDLDVMRGPVAFTRAMLSYFENCDSEKYGVKMGYIQHIAPLEAYADGHRVVGVNIDFFYPLAQRFEEDGPLLETMKAKWPRQFKECTDSYRKVAMALGLPKKT